MQRPIIAHELTMPCSTRRIKVGAQKNPRNYDATIARSAVIEGDATITMSLPDAASRHPRTPKLGRRHG